MTDHHLDTECSKKILYIQPYLFFCFSPQISSEPFLRFSNYLNSKKNELKSEIQEEYVDLRLEPLPEYCPENIEEYRSELKALLCGIYERFKFDIAAISCYSDFAYLNSIEIAFMIKNFVNPSCYIVVGGVHPTVYPENFNIENIPPYFKNFYPDSINPFDFIILDEGIKPFFNLVKNLINNKQINRSSLNLNPILLKREFLDTLDEIPSLNIELFRKYKKIINKIGNFYIRFNSGCSFRCKFCLPSEDYSKSSKIFKYRSLDYCLKDLKAIYESEWLKIRQLHIVDSMFFPKRSVRNKFFEELEKIYYNINFTINIFDRIETTTIEDLIKYKKYNIILGLGLETVSKQLLIKIGKTTGITPIQIDKQVHNYLDNTIKLIQYSNEIDLPLVFFYMLGVPGTDLETLKESWSFFFDKKYEGKALIEKYKISLEFFIFALFCGNTLYDKGEQMFGSNYYFKKWFKIFHKDQAAYSVTFTPSTNLNFYQHNRAILDFIIEVYRAQMKLKNPFYILPKLMWYKENLEKTKKIYEERGNPYTSDISQQISYYTLILLIFLLSYRFFLLFI